MKTKPLDDQEQHPAHPVHPVRSPAEVTNPFEWRTSPNIALCPERFPVEALLEQKRQLGTYSFSALYQQRPTPAGGQIFKREWFKQIIDFAPLLIGSRQQRRQRPNRSDAGSPSAPAPTSPTTPTPPTTPGPASSE